jgi:hypothetical protein
MVESDRKTHQITHVLSGEMFRALGFSSHGLMWRLFKPLVWNPIHQFSKIAVGFDQQVKQVGFQRASHWILPNFIRGMNVSGDAAIPRQGPLLVASNHPGAYDALVITANVPRDDIKIFVNIPLEFIRELPATFSHFLYVPPELHTRMKRVREAIQHLKDGGAILIFASGKIDPDPACMRGAIDRLCTWSRSLEIFLRRVPDTQVLLSIVSGILAPKYVNHILTRFRSEQSDKQRISEFLQVMRQLLYPGKLLQTPRISFANPLKGKDLMSGQMSNGLMQSLVDKAKGLFTDHMESAN